MIDQYGAIMERLSAGEEGRNWERTLLHFTSSTTTLARRHPSLNPRLRGKKPEPHNLSYRTTIVSSRNYRNCGTKEIKMQYIFSQTILI
jgi:hypothetical protein